MELGYTPFEIETALKSMVILYDTREQPTRQLELRLATMKCPTERRKLDYGDYSCFATLPTGEVLDLSRKAVVERKMCVDELCLCFGKERKRFKAEFERARLDGCRVYLLVENATWENILLGKYRSQYNPQALAASILAWIPRYNMIPIFCKGESSGKIIKEILYREVKEYLENAKEGGKYGQADAISGCG